MKQQFHFHNNIDYYLFLMLNINEWDIINYFKVIGDCVIEIKQNNHSIYFCIPTYVVLVKIRFVVN